MNEHNIYEVQVRVADDGLDYTYTVEHRFPQLPDVETLKALKDEAANAFDALNPGIEIDQVDVSCIYLTAEERGDGNGPTRERTTA